VRDPSPRPPARCSLPPSSPFPAASSRSSPPSQTKKGRPRQHRREERPWERKERIPWLSPIVPVTCACLPPLPMLHHRSHHHERRRLVLFSTAPGRQGAGSGCNPRSRGENTEEMERRENGWAVWPTGSGLGGRRCEAASEAVVHFLLFTP
jgi:hypothetical protein